jgi:5-methylcytosine-specific restriction endonuclease McrA
MGKKLPTTPRSRITSALRKVWLRSRERAAAIRREKNTCQRCGVKGSEAKGRVVKIQVHHIDGIDWDGVVDLVIERLLPDPSRLEVICKNCHDKEHEK